MTPLLVACGIAFVLSLGITGLVCAWAERRGILDAPDASRRIHTRSTPRLGGVGLALGTCAALFAFMFGLGTPRTHGEVVLRLHSMNGETVVFFSGLSFFAVGLLDDVRRLPALVKAVLQVGVAVACVGVTDVRFDGGSAGPWPSLAWATGSAPMTVLWILAVVNVINFLDGIDGIASVTAIVILGAAAAMEAQGSFVEYPPGYVFEPVLFPWLGGAALLGFAVWNAPPARVFMGDGGSHFLGYLAAACACGHGTWPYPWDRPRETTHEWHAPAAWPLVGAALLPAILDVLEALVHKARQGIPLSQAHADHLYQRLVKAGWGHGAVALRYGLLSLAGVVLAGPVATRWGIAAAVVPGVAILVIHWWTGLRATRAVPRLTRT